MTALMPGNSWLWQHCICRLSGIRDAVRELWEAEEHLEDAEELEAERAEQERREDAQYNDDDIEVVRVYGSRIRDDENDD